MAKTDKSIVLNKAIHIGDVTLYNRSGFTVARSRKNTKKKATATTKTQFATQMHLREVINAWQIFKEFFCFKETALLNFNQFKRANLRRSGSYLPKEVHQMGGFYVDNFLAASGLLQPVTYRMDNAFCTTDLRIGNLSITTDTDLQQLVQVLLKNNSLLKYGDTLTFLFLDETHREALDQDVPQVQWSRLNLYLQSAPSDRLWERSGQHRFDHLNQYLANRDGHLALVPTADFYAVFYQHNGEYSDGLCLPRAITASHAAAMTNEAFMGCAQSYDVKFSRKYLAAATPKIEDSGKYPQE